MISEWKLLCILLAGFGLLVVSGFSFARAWALRGGGSGRFCTRRHSGFRVYLVVGISAAAGAASLLFVGLVSYGLVLPILVASMRMRLGAIPHFGVPVEAFTGRGIVLTSSKSMLDLLAANLAAVMYIERSAVDVEFWYNGETDVSPADEARLREWFPRLSLVDVSKLPEGPARSAWLSSLCHQIYGVKVLATLFSRFREVIFLDYDSIPVIDPAVLFEEPSYRRFGNIFWPDLPCQHTSWLFPWVSTLSLPHSPLETESGQFALDKSVHYNSLAAILYMNGDQGDVFYHYLHGDKDTYSISIALQHPESVGQNLVRSPSIGLGGFWINEEYSAEVHRLDVSRGIKFTSFVHWLPSSQAPAFLHFVGLGKTFLKQLASPTILTHVYQVKDPYANTRDAVFSHGMLPPQWFRASVSMNLEREIPSSLPSPIAAALPAPGEHLPATTIFTRVASAWRCASSMEPCP